MSSLGAGLQGAGDGPKTRAGEARVRLICSNPHVGSSPSLLGGGSQEATALSRSPRSLQTGRAGEPAEDSGRQEVFTSSKLSQGSG